MNNNMWNENNNMYKKEEPWWSFLNTPIGFAILAAIIVGIAVSGWYLFSGPSPRLDAKGQLETVKADKDPHKVKPETPGGMTIPHQDKVIYQSMANDDQSPKVERVLPAPETPKPLSETPPQGSPSSTHNHGPAVEQHPPHGETTAHPTTAEKQATQPLPTNPTPSPGMEKLARLEPPASGAPSSVSEPSSHVSESEPHPDSLKDKIDEMKAKNSTPSVSETAQTPSDEVKSVEKEVSSPTLAKKQISLKKGKLGVQLGSFRNKATAQKELARLNRSKELRGLTGTIETAVLAKGTYYRIVYRGLSTHQDIKKLCSNLKKKRQACVPR